LEPKDAVLHIWTARTKAAEAATARGANDTGRRSEVTSGAHMDAIAELIAATFTEAGIPASSVFSHQRVQLPGYFRPEKKWDILVVHEGKLLAAIELKAISSSYGNNWNNRVEEALGNATDLAHSIKAGLTGNHAPWRGYVFIIHDEEASRRPVKCSGKPHFPVDKAFQGTSYQQRAEILCRRLMLERLYDRTWFVAADPATATVREPDPEMGWAKFKAAIEGVVGQALA
jgi:hypothetical protein